MNITYTGALPVYAIIRRGSDNYVWNGSTFVTWNDSNYSTYAVLLTDQGGDLFAADFPSSIDISPPDYIISYYEKAGGSYSTTLDLLLSSETQTWDGVSLEDNTSYSGWKSVFTPIVRNLINDTVVPYKFSDTRIHQTVVIAGMIVAQQITLGNDYLFNMNTIDIIPDPTAEDTYDAMAIALFSLKAACILTQNQYQTAIGTGIRVRDGDSEVDTTSGFGGFKDILTLGPCASYDKLVKDLIWKKMSGQGQAVLSPFSYSTSGAYFDYSIYGNVRDFFDYWTYC